MRTDKEIFKNVSIEKQWSLIRSYAYGFCLDIGSFDGLLLAHQQYSIGLDIDRHASYIPLIIGDMHHLPFRDEVFNTITTCHVLEHTKRVEVLLKEIRRCLKSKGRYIVVVPNAKIPAAILLKHFLGYDGYAYPNPELTSEFWTHKSFFGFVDLKNILIGNGFKIERYFGSVPYLPKIDFIFNYSILRLFSCKAGDVCKIFSRDIILICTKME